MRIQKFINIIKELFKKNKTFNQSQSTIDVDEESPTVEFEQSDDIKIYINELFAHKQFTKIKEILSTGLTLNNEQNKQLYNNFEYFLLYSGKSDFLNYLKSHTETPILFEDIHSLSQIPFLPSQIKKTKKFFEEFEFKKVNLATGGFAHFLSEEAILHNSNVGLTYNNFPEQTFELFANMLAINYPKPINGIEKFIPKELFVCFLVDFSNYFNEAKNVKQILKNVINNHQLKIDIPMLEHKFFPDKSIASFFKNISLFHMSKVNCFVEAYIYEYSNSFGYSQRHTPLFKKQNSIGVLKGELSNIVTHHRDRFSEGLDKIFQNMSTNFKNHDEMIEKIKKQIKENKKTPNSSNYSFTLYIENSHLSEELKKDLISVDKILNQMKNLDSRDEIQNYTKQISNQLIKTIDTAIEMKELGVIDDNKIKEMIKPMMDEVITQFNNINQQFISDLQQNKKIAAHRMKP